ncbi:MAG: FAD-binding protein [Patescibacteria group bacterium]|nr:FAD-binding protein [Patescibacteria group bacterium]
MYNKKNHNETINGIAHKIRRHVKSGSNKKLRFKHGRTHSTSSTRNQEDENYHFIDFSSLNHFIEINKSEGWLSVEPNVPMDKLAKETLKHGFLPPVVMEFPGITVGGGIQGAALESSSYKWGQFNDIALEYEIITGAGEVITATPQNNNDIFYGLSGSYGSLGLLTLAKIRVIPVKKYVRLTYFRTEGKENVLERIRQEIGNQANDFVEGIIFDAQNSVIITGEFSDEKSLPIQTFSKATDPWFWRHAQKITEKQDKYQELVPIYDYLFRYDRGSFWMGEYTFPRLHLPHNKITQFLLNPFMNTRRLYDALHALKVSKSYFIQDVYFPFDKAIDCLEYNEEKLDIYPLWLCPVKPTTTSQKLSPHFNKASVILDIGIWGQPKNIQENYFEINKDFEKFVTEKNARKMFYAETFYTEEEFWGIYNKDWYTELRNKYHADKIFSNVWQNIHVTQKLK